MGRLWAEPGSGRPADPGQRNLWLITAVLAIRQVAAALGTPRGERLTDLETWVGPNGVPN